MANNLAVIGSIIIRSARFLYAVYKHLSAKPTAPPPHVAKPPVEMKKTTAQLISEAQKRNGIDVVNMYNFAVVGTSGTGKSSMVNGLRFVPDNDPLAAKVDQTECTSKAVMYRSSVFPYMGFWDIPGAGTVEHPVATYFSDNSIFVYDCLVIVYAERLMVNELLIITEARKWRMPVVLVRNKTDIAISSMKNMDVKAATDDELLCELREKVLRNANEQFRLFAESSNYNQFTKAERERIRDTPIYLCSANTFVKDNSPQYDNSRLQEHLCNFAQTRSPKHDSSVQAAGKSHQSPFANLLNVAANYLQANNTNSYSGSSLSVGAAFLHANPVVAKLEAPAEGYNEKALTGDVDAMRNLGWCYENGRGVAQDWAQAVHWYRKAADKGDAGAMSSLGICYKNGDGVVQDYAQALQWHRKAAEKGNAVAMFNLGRSYANGRGIPQDYAQAVHWYRKAADQDHVDAMRNLGWCYANGRGAEKDNAQAIVWYRKAADKGDAKAMFNMGKCYENGIGVAKDPAQATQWYRKAANKGDTDGIERLKLSE